MQKSKERNTANLNTEYETHAYMTSVGLAKQDNSRHSLQNACMQKTSVELFAAGCLHNALEEATCEKGTIQIFTQGMNEVIFLEKHLFLQKR